VCERLPALLLQACHRQALLPDGSLLSTAVCLPEAELLQPLLRSSQVLCSGRLLRSGSVCSTLLPGSGCLLCAGSVLRSQVLRSSEVLCSGPGRVLRSGSLLCSQVLRSGPGRVLCSGALLCS
jgi:hypothetical protein